MIYLQESKEKEAVPSFISQSIVASTSGSISAPRSDPKPLVLVVDDIAAERECLVTTLTARCPEFEVAANTARSEQWTDVRPDVVLIGHASTDLQNCEAPNLIAPIQAALPDVPIVALVEDDDSATASAKLAEMGVISCLSYSAGIEGLTKVLWLVLHGGACFPRDCILQTRQTPPPMPELRHTPTVPPSMAHVTEIANTNSGLTQRECDVVGQLRQGKPNKIIAYELGISISTVKVHVRNIMRKTGATNRLEAALLLKERTNSHPTP